MTKTLSIAVAAALVTAAAGWVGSAQGADREFCHDYARAALNQVRGASSHERCDEHMDRNETRWSRDYRVHFDWCRGVSRDQAEDERQARRRTLEHCARHHDHDHD